MPLVDVPSSLEGATLDEAFPQEAKEVEVPAVDETTESETPSEETKPETKEEVKETESEVKEEEVEVEPEEPKVPLSRFREVMRERSELKAKIAERERESTLTEDERFQLDEDKRLEQKLEAIVIKREQRQSQKDADDADELIELMELYGTYDVDKVLDIKDQYKVKENEAAVKLYFKLFGTGSKPKAEPKVTTPKEKVPQPKGSAPVIPPTKQVDVSNKSLSQLIEEAKREAGI